MTTGIRPHLKAGFAERLKSSREAAGLSQRGLEFKGCTAVYISRMENGQRFPTLQLVNELARKLGVDAHWLATGKKDPVGLVVDLSRMILDEARSGVEVPGHLLDELEEALKAIER